MSKDAYYFSHDSNARNDEDILALRMKHGWEGYGLFWAIIEKLRESSDYVLKKDYNLLAYELRVSSEIIKSIIEDFGLFELTEDGKGFYSERLLRTMQKKEEISQKARKAANKRWSNADAMPSHSGSNANKKKEKESKEKKSIATPPTLEEVKKYFSEKGYDNQLAEKFYYYYQEPMEDRNGRVWKDKNGDTVQSWKQKAIGVWMKEDNKPKSTSDGYEVYR